MQFFGTLAWVVSQGWYGSDSIESSLECDRIMPIGFCHPNGQRHALGIYNKVSFTAEFAAIGWIGSDFLTRGGLGTLSPSTLACSQTLWSCSRNPRSIAKCSRCWIKRIPLSAARSSTEGRRPPLGDGTSFGINGSRTAHNSLKRTDTHQPPGQTDRQQFHRNLQWFNPRRMPQSALVRIFD